MSGVFQSFFFVDVTLVVLLLVSVNCWVLFSQSIYSISFLVIKIVCKVLVMVDLHPAVVFLSELY